MPRYRFAWTNLPPPLLKGLAQQLDVSPPIDAGLKRRYGARPTADFVREAWPVLLETWLPKDSAARSNITEQLSARKLGRLELPRRTAREQAAYLASCRNSTTLREVVAVVLTGAGEAATVHAPMPSATSLSENPVVTPGRPPASSSTTAADSLRGPDDDPPRTLTEWTLWAVGQILERENLEVDHDGDIPIPYGSALCYVRAREDPPSILVFAPLVVDLAVSPELLTEINAINLAIDVGKVVHTGGDEVVYSLLLVGEQLSVPILAASLEAATHIADHFDHQIQRRFGGKTLFPETASDSVMM